VDGNSLGVELGSELGRIDGDALGKMLGLPEGK
jgi:hypothetical protein